MLEIREKLINNLYKNIDNIFKESNEKEVIFIGESYYKDIFLTYKRNRPYYNLSFKTRSEVIEELEFKPTHSMIKYIIHNYNYDYVNATKLLKILPFININNDFSLLNNKEKEVIKIKEELINNRLIKYDDYSLISYTSDNVILVLFEIDEIKDKSFITLLNNHHISSYLSLSFIELDNEEIRAGFNNKIYYFKNHIKEENYLGSTISKLLLEDNIDPSNIYIYLSNDYDYYISILESLYNLKFNYIYKRPLSSNPIISKYISLFSTKNKIELIDTNDIDDKEKTYVNYINDIINEYSLNNISNFNKAFISLNEILSSINETKPSLIDGIKLIDKPLFNLDNNSLFFMLDFKHNVFYKEYKDDDIISDNTLAKLNLTTSYEKTLRSKRLMLYFSLFNNVVFFSRVKLHLDEKIYDSQYIDEYNLVPRDKEINLDGLYTKYAKELVYKAFLNDKKNISNGSYDPSFKKFKLTKKDEISISSLEEFNSCPFKYYVSKYLKIDPYSTDYKRMIGNTLHLFLEDYQQYKNLSLEEMKDVIINKLLPIEENKNKYYFSDKEKIIFEETVIPYFKKAFDEIINFLGEEVSSFSKENDLHFILKDNENNEVKLIGRYDALFNLKDDSYIILDYKSGKHVELKVDTIDEGKKLQVPLYAYAISKEKETSNVSAYLQPILQEIGHKDGFYVNEDTYQKGLAPKGFDSASLFNKDNPIIDKVLVVTKTLLTSINNLDFDVNPSSEDENTSPCTYCNYKDICFKKE